MLAYSLPAFLQGDVTGFLAGVARVNGLIKKVGASARCVDGVLMARQRGVLDHAGAARVVLRDWCTGKLMRYSMPEGTPEGTADGDTAVLGSVRSRKELRSAVEVKLVKMDAGVSDKRDVEWDVVWGEDEEEESGDDEEEEEENEEEGEGEGEEEPGRRPEKRKVSFAIETEKRRRR